MKLAGLITCGLVMLVMADASGAPAVHGSGRVTYVESTFMPDWVVFRLDAAIGSCPVGAYWYLRSANPEKVKAAYSLLLSRS